MTYYRDSYVVGIDLGKAQDYTAIAILERKYQQDNRGREIRPICHLRHLDRYRLGMPYTEIVENIREIMSKDPLCKISGQFRDIIRPQASLIVDNTGVGAAVTDLMVQRDLRPVRVMITSGVNVVSENSYSYNVPKRELITGLQVGFQERRLLVADGLALGPTFIKELMSVDYKLTPSANDVYTHREGTHDDLVLAVSLAYWYAVYRQSNAMVSGFLDPYSGRLISPPRPITPNFI